MFTWSENFQDDLKISLRVLIQVKRKAREFQLSPFLYVAVHVTSDGSEFVERVGNDSIVWRFGRRR